MSDVITAGDAKAVATLEQLLDNPLTLVDEKPPIDAPKKPSWKFVKTEGVGQVFEFKDGTTFKFRKIPLSSGLGFSPTSEVVTEDEQLAKNLRSVVKAGNAFVFEVQ